MSILCEMRGEHISCKDHARYDLAVKKLDDELLNDNVEEIEVDREAEDERYGAVGVDFSTDDWMRLKLLMSSARRLSMKPMMKVMTAS